MHTHLPISHICMPPGQSMFSVIPAPPNSRSQWSNAHARSDLKPVPFAFSDEPVRQKIGTIKRVNDRPPQLAELALGEKESMSSHHCCAGFSISSSSHSSRTPSLPCLLPWTLIARAHAGKWDHAGSGVSLGQWQEMKQGEATWLSWQMIVQLP